MSKSKFSFILLLLCVSVMPLTVYQVGAYSGRNPNADLPTFTPPSARPSINQPIARPTMNQPTTRPTISQPTASFTRPPALASISYTRSIATIFTPPPLTSISFTRSIVTSFSFSTSQWTGISFTRTVVTSTFNPTFTWTTTTVNYYPTYGGFTFIQYPSNYNSNVGSFTLDQTLIGPNGVPCTYYTYFEFNANAGQQLQARVWTPGATINYIIVPQNLVPILQQMGCGYDQLGPRSQAHSFNSQVTLNWTAPETDQYVIIFYSLTPYSGTVFFVPGAQ